ncbi:cytochrome C oxidase subunit IV family protein [Paremcibacter congregatus]|uniref:cytochrome C oxidase subunit IV family protein n=1 Tax=Paremcibacter congregatus TaxID=2043170 RepID=UPI0030EF5466|tara:strand:- start:836 stop:1120 length:285 start_codon:yes stop_codon:yes gene_type:complete
MNFQSPPPRALVFCWLFLLLLTLASMFSGQATRLITLSAPMIFTLGLITWGKALLMLRYYLNLKAASRGWNKAFGGYLFIVTGLLTAIFLIGKT